MKQQLSHDKGLTLIEVLIALAIIAIAMMAVIQTVTQNIRSTTYLQNKTIALWVAQQALNEVKAGLRKSTSGQENLKYQTTMFNQTWYWHLLQEATPNPHIAQIEVRVYDYDTDDIEAQPVTRLTTFLYKPSEK